MLGLDKNTDREEVVRAVIKVKAKSDAHDEMEAKLHQQIALVEAGKDQLAKANASVEEMKAEAYPYPIAFNVLAQIGGAQEGHPSEELKMARETHKILEDDSIRVSCTCVRVPVFNSHSEALHVSFDKPVTPEAAREVLAQADGVELADDIDNAIYPMPMNANGKEEVLVGRIRKDQGFDNGLSLFVAGDNLWKGAALNAIQIAEKLVEMEG